MSNAAGVQAKREEEIAFLAMEQVLAVEIGLADAGAGNKKPDGAWIYPSKDGQARKAIVEITSPPAEKLLRSWAAAKREGRPQRESGAMSTRFGELAQVCTELLAENWAQGNIDKLLAEPADERHLFLFARGYNVGDYFYRLAGPFDDEPAERVDDIVLPDGISDVWFRGQARPDRDQPMAATDIRLARFQTSSGWHRYLVTIEERRLPSPNASIADDSVPEGWRQPKDRTVAISQQQ